MNYRFWKLLLPVGIGLEILTLIWAYYESRQDLTLFFQSTARLSGRISLLFFSIFTVYATLEHTNEKANGELDMSYTLLRNFAIVHLIHFVFLAAAVKLSGVELVFYRLLGGILAYLMIILFPFILKKNSLKSLTISRLKNIYIIYVWLIFFLTYLPRVLGKATNVTGSMTSYFCLMTFTVGLMIWRISKLISCNKFSLI